MNRRFALVALPLLLALPLSSALAATTHKRGHVAPPAPPAPLPDTVRVDLVTQQGTIVVELDGKHAPISTANFLRYVDQRRFDGIAFFRSMRLAWGQQPNGLIQAGVSRIPGRALKPIAHEPTSTTGILHKAGTLSMARFAPGTATGDFSIMLSDMPGLDADPASADPEAKAGYAAFGHVVDGMDVVQKIFESPLSATLGDGVMKGQMIEKPVVILRARRAPNPPPVPVPVPGDGASHP